MPTEKVTSKRNKSENGSYTISKTNLRDNIAVAGCRRRGLCSRRSALNEILNAPRLSADVDLFHDTEEALFATWNSDRKLLVDSGLELTIIRERTSFIEASVTCGSEFTKLQWTRDSAFRFFPLVENPEFGLTLHPVDLATNKVLALIGRTEARDWIDVVTCHERLQRLGYLAWAACGKDPGFGPKMILEEASRTCRYTEDDIALLQFQQERPSARALSVSWHAMLKDAHELIEAMPETEAGKCVLTTRLELFNGDYTALIDDLRHERVRFHAGHIRGSLPLPCD